VAGYAGELDAVAGQPGCGDVGVSVRALAVLAGWLVDLAAGDPRRAHPVALFGAAAVRAERVLYRDARWAGVGYTALLVGAPTLAAGLAERRLGARARLLLLAVLTWTALGGRSLWREAAGVGDAVARGDLADARRRLPALCGRDPSGLDGPQLCRAAIESVAENTADAVVAPLLYAALLGAPGVVAHRCANTLDAMVGHRSPRYARFGWAAARLDDLLAFVPARVTALLAALASGTPRRVVGVVRRDGGRHPSPNAGRAEAAFAGALGVRLGGANRYGAQVSVRGPLGDGPAPAPRDVRRAIRLSRAVAGRAVVGCAALGGLTRNRPPSRGRR
jgi:adenosylcobinamide-phosphate synthase